MEFGLKMTAQAGYLSYYIQHRQYEYMSLRALDNLRVYNTEALRRHFKTGLPCISNAPSTIDCTKLRTGPSRRGANPYVTAAPAIGAPRHVTPAR